MIHRHTLALVAAFAALALLPAATFAAGGTDHFGPFAGTSPDGGSCGAPWADDTFDRFFTVHDNGDGTFRVTEEFKTGTFATIGTVSPGACEDAPHHGSSVVPGITGNMQGFLDGTVSGGTYDPNGCDANPTVCTTTAGFIAAVFGPSATYSVGSFNFEYSSSDHSLRYHHWQDKSDNQGNDQFVGDIAVA